jgi:hypothetical protein
MFMALAAYELVNLALLFIITSTVRSTVRLMNQSDRRFHPYRALWWAALIPLTQCIYGKAIVATMFSRSIEWRGIVYDIRKCAEGFDIVVG